MGGSESENSNLIMFFLENDTKTVVRLQGENFVGVGVGGFHTRAYRLCLYLKGCFVWNSGLIH